MADRRAPSEEARLSMSGTRFVAVGDVMIDVTASGAGHAARISLAPGGSAVNAAIWAAVAGADATVVGRVGDDLAGRSLRTALQERGVGSEFSVDLEVATGTFLVVDGEIRADRGANARFSPDDLPDLLEADVVLVSGYLPGPTVAKALERAEGTWLALAPAFLDPLPSGANAILVDNVEALRITGSAPEEAARMLGERFRLACVTCGADGAVAVLDGRIATRRSEPVDNASQVGAGDAFAAGLLVALARGTGLRAALDAGCGLGAAVAAGVPP
jgi:sugar/nucleoside kinase (ribokinase family)